MIARASGESVRSDRRGCSSINGQYPDPRQSSRWEARTMIRPPMNAVEGHLWTLRPRRFAEGRERPMSKVNAGHMLSHFGVQHFGAPLIVSRARKRTNICGLLASSTEHGAALTWRRHRGTDDKWVG